VKNVLVRDVRRIAGHGEYRGEVYLGEFFAVYSPHPPQVLEAAGRAFLLYIFFIGCWCSSHALAS
jgi:hypothetical protein